MYDEVLPKKLRDKILRDLKAKPAKAVKHEAGPDHDQADHGSWASNTGSSPDDVDKTDLGTAMEYIPAGPTALLDRWTWNGYSDLNSYLRDPVQREGMSDKDRAAVELMSQDMESLIKDQTPIDADTTLFRGVTGLGQVPEVGSVFTDQGFMATSVSEKVAMDFVLFGDNPMLFHIETPEGTKVLFTDEYTSRDRKEGEAVLQRGTSLEITATEKTTRPIVLRYNNEPVDKEITIVYAKIVPTPVKSLKHGDHDQNDHGAWAHGGNLESNPPLSGASRREADKTLSAMYNTNDLNGPLADKLEMTDLQVYAAQHYRSTGYMEINNLLRGDGSDWGREFSPADIRAIELLDETMQKSTLDEFTTVYRGTHMMSGEASTFLDGLKVGEVYTDPTFVSTTRDEDVARDFALNRAPDDAAENRTSIIWELVAPSGTSAIDIEKLFPGYGSHEREVLLGRDTHFRILGKEDGGYGPSGEPVIRIKATVIPTAVKSLKHGDHDQSDHGAWARGGGVLARNADKFKEAGGKTTSHVFKTEAAMMKKLVKDITGLHKDRDSIVKAIHAQEDKGKDAAALYRKKLGIDLLQKALQPQEDYSSNTRVLIARGPDGKMCGALSYYEPQGEPFLTVQFLGSTQDVSGTGTALMREAMQIALDGNRTFAVLEPTEDARPWYESLGLGEMVFDRRSNSKYYEVGPDALKEILGSPVKSLKHGDHDQADHGSWATGGGESRSKESLELFAKDDPEAYINKNEREELANKWSEKLDRQITEQDVLSVDNYKRWGSAEINQYLRGQSEPNSERKGYVQDRVDGIRNLAKPLDRDTVVYRWVPNATSTGDPISGVLQKAYEDGTAVSDSGFMSTSTEVTGGQAWGRNFIAIEVPAGTPVVDFDDWMPELNAEKEILLMPDTEMMLTYAETLEDGSKRFVASVVGPGTKSLKHGDHDQLDHGNWATGGGFRKVSANEFEEAYKRNSASTILPTNEGVRRSLALYSAAKIDDDDGTPVHASINSALREGRTLDQALRELEPEDRKAFKEFDKQFQPTDKGWKEVPAVLIQETRLFRGMPALLYPEDVEALRSGQPFDFGFGILKPGDVVADAGYGSTSTDARHAQYFGDKPVIPPDEQTEDSPEQIAVVWQITAPEGTPALSVNHNIDPADQVYGEEEIILARDTHYEITNVTYNAAGSVLVEARVIPTHSTTKP